MDIRSMTLADLSLVLGIQQRSYPQAFHEPLAAFENKLRQSPGSAWLAMSDEQAQAYLVTLPVDETHFPALHAAHWTPPVQAKWLYLHDLAVDPGHRGSGAGQRLIDQAIGHARLLGLEGLALIAVQGSQPYWERQGFQASLTNHPVLLGKIRSFGNDACFMLRD